MKVRDSVYSRRISLGYTIAYCNFELKHKDLLASDIFRTLIEDEIKDGKSEEEAGYSIYYSYSKEKEDKATGDDAAMIQETKVFIDVVARGDKCEGCKIVDVRNDESDSGLYAVVIETAEDEASSFFTVQQYVLGRISNDFTIFIQIQTIYLREIAISDSYACVI